MVPKRPWVITDVKQRNKCGQARQASVYAGISQQFQKPMA